MYTYRVEEVVRVIDGDTVELLIDLGFNTLTKQKVRLRAINAPEIRGPEKEKGVQSKEHLYTLLHSYDVDTLYVETIKDKQGKYGRYLCTIFAKQKDTSTEVIINNQMVIDGFAEWSNY